MGRKRPTNNPDPIFAAEVAALLEERRTAFVGDFPARWAERLAKGVKLPAELRPYARTRA